MTQTIEDTRILFLGNCADPDTSPDDPNVVMSKLRYHREIYAILKDVSKSVIGTNDPMDLLKRKGEYDIVFSLFNRMGFNSSELFASSLCEFLKVPYLGSAPEIRGVAENKSLFKHIVRSLNIPSAESQYFLVDEEIENTNNLKAPFFVKPRSGANSEWIMPTSYCENWEAVVKEVKTLHNKELAASVEEYLPGINLTVPILGGKTPTVLGIVEAPTHADHNILTSEEKVQDHGDMSYNIFKNDVIEKQIAEHAKMLNNTLRPIDYFRIDYRYNPNENSISILEVNICCDISSFGSFAFAAEHYGLSHKELVIKILKNCLSRI